MFQHMLRCEIQRGKLLDEVFGGVEVVLPSVPKWFDCTEKFFEFIVERWNLQQMIWLKELGLCGV